MQSLNDAFLRPRHLLAPAFFTMSLFHSLLLLSFYSPCPFWCFENFWFIFILLVFTLIWTVFIMEKYGDIHLPTILAIFGSAWCLAVIHTVTQSSLSSFSRTWSLQLETQQWPSPQPTALSTSSIPRSNDWWPHVPHTVLILLWLAHSLRLIHVGAGSNILLLSLA